MQRARVAGGLAARPGLGWIAAGAVTAAGRSGWVMYQALSTCSLVSRMRAAALATAVITGTVGAVVVPAASAASAVAAPPAAVAAVPTGATPTAVSRTTCRLRWGSGPKAAGTVNAATVRNVRAGRNACYDRLVVDLAGSRTNAGYDVRYVPRVYQDGSGAVVPLRGAARLAVIVRAAAYDSVGRSTYRPRSRTELVALGGYRTFRQASWAGSFEGQTTIGLGVRARLPMRAFVLRSGTSQMLVIDVAHSWS